jgi:hypothetical protein
MLCSLSSSHTLATVVEGSTHTKAGFFSTTCASVASSRNLRCASISPSAHLFLFVEEATTRHHAQMVSHQSLAIVYLSSSFTGARPNKNQTHKKGKRKIEEEINIQNH